MSERCIDSCQNQLTPSSHVGVLTLHNVDREGVGCSGCLRNTTWKHMKKKKTQCSNTVFLFSNTPI